MFLYNVTVNIDLEKEEEYVEWMKNTHIPQVMETGMFRENKFFRLLHEAEDGGVNYSVQYFTDSMEKILIYQEKFAPALREDMNRKFENHFVSFRSVLELVSWQKSS